MLTIKKLLSSYTLLFAVLFTACKNGEKVQPASTQVEKEGNEISFKVDGKLVTTSGWNISRFDMGSGLNLNVTTDMHKDNRTVMLNLRGIEQGTYSLGEHASGKFSGYGDYKPDYTNLTNSYRFTEGSFTIQGIDTTNGLLNASFFATARKGDEIIHITDGKIVDGHLNKTIQTY